MSLVNTVLCTIWADSFGHLADQIEAGGKPAEVAAAALDQHWKVIFNGNNYDEANQEALTKAGVWRIDSGVDSLQRLSDPKNVDLFSRHGVLNEKECKARTAVLLDHYSGTVEMEALCMVDMIKQHVIPAVVNAEARWGGDGAEMGRDVGGGGRPPRAVRVFPPRVSCLPV